MKRFLPLLIVAACSRGGGKPPVVDEAPIPAPPADAIVKDTDAGAAQIHVQVWPAAPTLGDSIWLRLEVTAKPGVAVELPFDQAALGRFQVLRYVPESSRADDGGARRVDTYELAAPMSGRHRIPPLRVVVDDQRPDGLRDREVLTDEVPIVVATVLAEKTDAQLTAPSGTLDPEVGGGVWWTLIFAIAGIVAVALAIVLWLVLRARAERRSRVDAWEVAMQRLDELERAGAPEADAADAWFVKLSAIVRAYVEIRFQLRAPELTTEEFLLHARRIPALASLGPFLEKCDRVKFAGWRPESAESLEVLKAARSFVEETRPREEETQPPPTIRVHAEAA